MGEANREAGSSPGLVENQSLEVWWSLNANLLDDFKNPVAFELIDNVS